MATITDYGSLKTAIQTWTARTDSVMGNQVPLFVEMAEQRLYDGSGKPGDELYTPPLRSQTMETTGTITLTDGVGSMPANTLAVRRIYQDGDLDGLTYITPERWSVFSAANTAGGGGIYYTVDDGVIKVTPTDSTDLMISYYQSFDPVTPANPTSALLTAHSTLYLSACLFEAFSFMQDPALAAGHISRLRSQIAGANQTATAMRMPTALRIRVRNHIP